MGSTQILVDEFGIIKEANKILPKNLKEKFIASLAELEDRDCYKNNIFPVTRLHKVKGITQAIYRADIGKISGWRIHIQYSGTPHTIILKQITEGQAHDDCIQVIKSHIDRYQ